MCFTNTITDHRPVVSSFPAWQQHPHLSRVKVKNLAPPVGRPIAPAPWVLRVDHEVLRGVQGLQPGVAGAQVFPQDT